MRISKGHRKELRLFSRQARQGRGAQETAAGKRRHWGPGSPRAPALAAASRGPHGPFLRASLPSPSSVGASFPPFPLAGAPPTGTPPLEGSATL